MALKIKEVRLFCEWYILESIGMISFRECVKSCCIAHARPCSICTASREQDFGLVNPEFRIIEGRITEVLF